MIAFQIYELVRTKLFWKHMEEDRLELRKISEQYLKKGEIEND